MIFVAALYIVDNYTVGTKVFRIKDEKIPRSFDGYKILHLSDLHNSNYGNQNDVLIKKINKLNPDLVFYTGDMVDKSSANSSNFFNLAKALSQNYPAYYIAGNHEDRLRDTDKKKLFSEIESLGINILDNEKVKLKRDESEINLYALNLESKYYRETYDKLTKELQLSKENIEAILGVKEAGYTILLTHNPLYFEAYADYGADLSFSGHVHGGLIRLPIIGGILSPDRIFNPKYDRGLFEKKGSKIITSPGLGGTKFRFFNRPMIYMVILEAEATQHH
ncbi:MAG: metallophosphoesterase [Clostridiaceae bacterium]